MNSLADFKVDEQTDEQLLNASHAINNHFQPILKHNKIYNIPPAFVNIRAFFISQKRDSLCFGK